MSKISTYEVAPVPKLSDKLIGTSVGGEIEDITYNFTLLELLELFLPIIPANNLQGVLDYGNTATQDINLFGTITTTNLDVTDTANLFITYLNEETHLVGSLFDSADSVGTAGQVLTSTGDGVEWFTLPPIFTPNLEQVLTEGNTSSIDILLDANLEALDVSADTATVGVNLTLGGTVTDNNAAVGSAGQVLSSTVTGVAWVSLPVYSATSPLLFNSATGVFSIQVANSTQGGYLTANDWVTFDGKQNAGAYITALTGEATATGPGSVPITLNNASVTAKVLTGLNVTGGSISASDSILTAFGKVQSQINGLMGGVQYQGVWDAATNTPTLTSSVGTQGHYYIVNVAGSTDLNGITDWKVGDWAIFSGGTWQKVDNTESVTSVNGQTGAVSLTTDNIPEGATNLYYLDSRARAALSFAAGSGAYNSLTGVITIPTDNSQILNGAGYITLSSISATSPLAYNNLTGVFSIQQADATHNGYLSSTDWSTFNNKQNYLGGTGLVKSTAGTITYITDNSGNWNTAYNRSIISAAVTGTTTKTLTLNEQDGNTITASWTDLDTGLTSVGVSMPSAFSVANSPLTSNGTIAVTGAGTTLEYIDGTGALRTFPGLTGYVPYTGATQNVDLGEYGISAGYFQADLTPTGALQVGRMQWNSTDGTMDLRLLGNNVTLQIGQENVTRVVNKSGIDLLEANYQVVRIRKVAEGGAQGQRLAVVLAQGNNENNSTEVIGLVTETILVNQEGFVTSFGEVKEIDTTGSLQGETWVDGDILYLSSTVAGQLTNVRPVAPNHSVIVGYVTYAHAVHGKIYMAIDTGYELGELHNVYAPSPTANQSIYWNVANSRYQLNTIGGILGYTPANAATLISTTAPLQGGGDLSTNRTFSITQSGASTDGYLSSIDWNTFNNKQPAGSYVPTSRLLSINGTQYDLSADRSWSVGTVTSVAALTLGTIGTDLSSSVATGTTTPVITLNVPTSSAANRGALSAADWSTFNTKVGSVTASSPLASSGGQTPNITIQQSSGSQDGYLSSTDWTTFNNKQAAGNYITSLTGEATATGPGAAAVTLNNASVTAKILTGINITGGTVQATDTMLTAFGKLQNQINGLIGSTIYQGTWNASTNTPALASGVGVRGYYYIVSVAGTTNLDGITDWFIGDWAIFDGTAWQQVDNTDAVVSVNGQTGAVSLTTDNIPEGATNQYFTQSRARASLSFAAGSGAYNSTSGLITIPTNTNQLTNGASFITLASLSGTAPIVYSNTTGAISITQAGTASNGYLSSTDWNTFNNKQASGNYVTTDTTQSISGLKTFTSVITSTVSAGDSLNLNKPTGPQITLNKTNATAQSWGIAADPNFRIINITLSNDALSFNFATNSALFNSSVTSTSFIKTGGTSSQFLKADGSIDSNTYLTTSSASSIYVPYTGATTNVNLGNNSLNIGATAVTDRMFQVSGVNFTTGATQFMSVFNTTFNGTITNVYGIYAGNNFGTGTITNSYNLFVESTNAGSATITNRYGIYQAGATDTNYFAGPTQVNGEFGVADNKGVRLRGVSDSTHKLYYNSTLPGIILEINNSFRIQFYNAGTPATRFTFSTAGDFTSIGAITGSIGALATASNAFVVSDSGTLKYRTAAQVLSDIGAQSVLTNPVTGTGNNDYIAKFTSTGSTIGNSLLQSVSTNVFINQENTSIGIDAQANTRLGFTKKSGFNPYLTYATDPFVIASSSGLNIAATNTFTTRLQLSITGELSIYNFFNLINAVTPGIYLDNTGRVGGAGRQWSILNGNTAAGEFSIKDETALKTRFKIATDGVVTSYVSALIGIETDATAYMRISENQIWRTAGSLYINNSASGNIIVAGGGGNVLINTATDSGYKLDVNGTGRFSGDLNVISAGSTAVLIDGTSPTITLRRSNNGNASSAINFKGSTVIKWQIGTNQAIGLGFEVNEGDATANRFYMAPGGASTFTSSVTAASFAVGQMILNSNQLYRSSAEEMYLNYSGTGHTILGNSTGNVSINAGTNPGYKLTVIGVTDIQAVRVPQLTLLRLSTTTLSSDVNDEISIDIGRGGMSKYSGRISGYISNFSTYDGGLKFYTSSSGTLNTTPALTLISTGAATFSSNVNVNTYLSLGTGSGKFLAVGGAVTAGSSADMLMYNTGGDIIFWATGGAGMTLKATSGNLGIGGSPNLRLTVADSGTVITSGTVTFATQAKGLEIFNNVSGTTDNLIGCWFSTGPHKAGIASGRTNAASTWGVDLRFFVHGPEIAQLDQTYEKMRLLDTGYLLVGYSSSQGSYMIQANGSIYASAFYESSDIRLKNVINKYNSNNFGAITFNWKDNRDTKLHWGYSAQNVLEYLPDAVNKNTDGTLTVDYNQAHTYKIAIIEDEVDVLKRRVTELESKLQKYEA